MKGEQQELKAKQLKKVSDFIDGEVTYDKQGQYFFCNGKMVAMMRGWSDMEKRFDDPNKAMEFQDLVGQYIADAINEKAQREQTNKQVPN